MTGKSRIIAICRIFKMR